MGYKDPAVPLADKTFWGLSRHPKGVDCAHFVLKPTSL